MPCSNVVTPNFNVVSVNPSTDAALCIRSGFGGLKNSGIGRDGGDWSFDFYMETKNVAFATTEHTIQKLAS